MRDDLDSLSGVIRLDDYWPYQLVVLADRISRRTARVVRDEAGLNLSQWRVLAAIAEVPGRTANDVVAVTPMDKGIVSRATKGLLELGLIRREASQDDGRISHLYLTADGQSLYARLIPGVAAVVDQASPHLSGQDQSVLSDHLRELLEALPDER